MSETILQLIKFSDYDTPTIFWLFHKAEILANLHKRKSKWKITGKGTGRGWISFTGIALTKVITTSYFLAYDDKKQLLYFLSAKSSQIFKVRGFCFATVLKVAVINRCTYAKKMQSCGLWNALNFLEQVIQALICFFFFNLIHFLQFPLWSTISFSSKLAHYPSDQSQNALTECNLPTHNATNPRKTGRIQTYPGWLQLAQANRNWPNIGIGPWHVHLKNWEEWFFHFSQLWF